MHKRFNTRLWLLWALAPHLSGGKGGDRAASPRFACLPLCVCVKIEHIHEEGLTSETTVLLRNAWRLRSSASKDLVCDLLVTFLMSLKT